MINHSNYKYITSDMKMSDVIFDNTYFILMLEHFEIELTLQEKTIKQICNEKKIDIDLLLTFANLYNGGQFKEINYSFDIVPTIVNYLQKSHDYYLKEKLPKIQFYIQELYKINEKSEIFLLEKFFSEYLNEITEHLNFESNVVYPYVINLFNMISNKNNSLKENFSVINYKEHHNDIEDKLADFKNLLIKYLSLNDEQNIRRKLLFNLFELEFDLNIHTMIEDSILIPIVERMEQSKENSL